MSEVTAVVVDNGEDLLEDCIWTLRDQTVPPEIILVGGDKTDYALARSSCDKVYGPISGIGEARTYGILAAKEFIISCDSDTLYPSNYVETAYKLLQEYEYVMATRAEPIEWPDDSIKRVRIFIEQMWYPFMPYDHGLAYRKSAVIRDLGDQKFIGFWDDVERHIVLSGVLIYPSDEMCVYTRLPSLYLERAVPDLISGHGGGLLELVSKNIGQLCGLNTTY